MSSRYKTPDRFGFMPITDFSSDSSSSSSSDEQDVARKKKTTASATTPKQASPGYGVGVGRKQIVQKKRKKSKFNAKDNEENLKFIEKEKEECKKKLCKKLKVNSLEEAMKQSTSDILKCQKYSDKYKEVLKRSRETSQKFQIENNFNATELQLKHHRLQFQQGSMFYKKLIKMVSIY